MNGYKYSPQASGKTRNALRVPELWCRIQLGRVGSMDKPRLRLSLGEKVKLRLKRMGLTQQKLVRRTGLNKGTISRIVNDRADPQASTVEKIARALEITVSELYPSYPEGEAGGTFEIAEPEGRRERAGGVLVVGKETQRPGARLFEQVAARKLRGERWKALEVTTERFVPLAGPGQFILFSEDEPADQGDFVFCELRDGRQYVARCRFNNVARTEITLLDPVPPAKGPLVVRELELVGLYRIIGVKF